MGIYQTLLKKISTVLLPCCLFHFSFSQVSFSDTTKRPDSVIFSILNEVVVSASRIKEKILQSPVSIQKAGQKYFNESPAPSFFDALEMYRITNDTPSLQSDQCAGFAIRQYCVLRSWMGWTAVPRRPIGNALGQT
jgi:hypothetical protein